MDQEKIYNALGNPFYFGTDIGTPLGYKTRDYYAFFIDGKFQYIKEKRLIKTRMNKLML